MLLGLRFLYGIDDAYVYGRTRARFWGNSDPTAFVLAAQQQK